MPHSQHLVFVYGGLRRGFGTNEVMEKWGGEHIGEASYPQGHSRMVSLGAMPGLIPDAGGPFIMGDLYRVSWPTLIAMDKLECAPHFFRRVKGKVHTSEGEELRAWLYVLANPSRFSDAKVVECGDWKVYQANELKSFLDLVDRARKGDELPKEYAVNESATCTWSPKWNQPTSSVVVGSSSYETAASRYKSETDKRADEFAKERERRQKSIDEIRQKHLAMKAKLEAKSQKLAMANRVFGGGEEIPPTQQVFTEEVVKSLNSLEKGRHIVVKSIGGSIVTFKRNDSNLLEVVDWHAGHMYKPGDGFTEEPAKDLETLSDDTEEVDDAPDIVVEYESEAVSECVFCNEEIEYIPRIGWVGQNLSPQCLVAPAVSDTQCHAAPSKDKQFTYDPEWGEGAND